MSSILECQNNAVTLPAGFHLVEFVSDHYDFSHFLAHLRTGDQQPLILNSAITFACLTLSFTFIPQVV